MFMCVVTKKRMMTVGIIIVLAIVAVLLAIFSGDGGGQQGAAAISKDLPIYHVKQSQKRIAISFDVAWGQEKTQEILKILQDQKIMTTFFVTGFWVDKYPDKVRMMASAGHEIGNHSTNHLHMNALSRGQMESEIAATNDRVKQLVGKKPILFRPPFGEYNDTLMRVAKEQGLQSVMWSVDSLDWQEKGSDAMIKQVIKNVHNGDIILFHNNTGSIEKALPQILSQLSKNGYTVVPVSQLLLPAPSFVDASGLQCPGGQ